MAVQILTAEVILKRGNMKWTRQVPASNNYRVEKFLRPILQSYPPEWLFAFLWVEFWTNVDDPTLELYLIHQTEMFCVFGQVMVHIFMIWKILNSFVKVQIVETGNATRCINMKRSIS